MSDEKKGEEREEITFETVKVKKKSAPSEKDFTMAEPKDE